MENFNAQTDPVQPLNSRSSANLKKRSNIKFLIITAMVLIFTSCATIPKETVELSKVIGNDLKILHNSHKSIVELYYKEIIDNVNTFVDDVYSPYIIHYVLKIELEKFENGEESIYGIIKTAGEKEGKEYTAAALDVMNEFLQDANHQVELKRKELIQPIVLERDSLLMVIDKSYQNTIHANSTLTGHLQSIQKVKKSQQEALKVVGLEGKDEDLNGILLKASELTKEAVTKGKEIDVKSDEAYDQIKEIISQIQKLTNN